MDVKELQDRIDKLAEIHEFGGWSASRISIGRVLLENVSVRSREGMTNLIDGLDLILRMTRRRMAGAPMDPLEMRVPGPSRLLSAEIEEYLKWLVSRQLSDCYVNNSRFGLRQLVSTIGDISVNQVEHDHIVQFWEALRWWPRGATQDNRFKGMTDKEIVAWGEANNTEAPAARTMNFRLQLVRSFFAWQIKKGTISKNPTAAIMLAKVDNLTNKRRAFRDGELQAMFDPERFLPWAAKYPHRFWMPILGLYTGARVGEIAQLKVKDVEQIEGRWVIHIRQTVDDDLADNPFYKTRARLKCPTAQRVIPIAQEVIDAGFLEFVEDMRECRHPRLFPHLKCPINKKTGLPEQTGYAPAFKMQFRTYLRRFVAEDQTGFHSFRHRFITVLRARRVPLDVIGSISGHRVEGQDRRGRSMIEQFYTDQPLYAEILGHPLQDQILALTRLLHPLVLPRYTRKQFAHTLGNRAKLYP